MENGNRKVYVKKIKNTRTWYKVKQDIRKSKNDDR